jgi:hypothetical protein
MTQSREIPVFCEDFAYGERLYESEPAYSFYPCPVTGNNILSQEHPDELLVYYDNLDSQITHLNTRCHAIYQDYQKEEYSFDSDFINYLIDRLPADLPIYHLVISHPDGVGGDFVELLYEGVYSRDWVPINDEDVEDDSQDVTFEEEIASHSKEDIESAITANNGSKVADLTWSQSRRCKLK